MTRSDSLVSTKDTCTRLGGISRWTLAREVEAGKLRVVKVRGLNMYRESDIERYIERRTRVAA